MFQDLVFLSDVLPVHQFAYAIIRKGKTLKSAIVGTGFWAFIWKIMKEIQGLVWVINRFNFKKCIIYNFIYILLEKCHI